MRDGTNREILTCVREAVDKARNRRPDDMDKWLTALFDLTLMIGMHSEVGEIIGLEEKLGIRIDPHQKIWRR